MPKKKTGQRKKAEKQKLRQKEIRTAKDNISLGEHPANSLMVTISFHLPSNKYHHCHKYILYSLFASNKTSWHAPDEQKSF